MTSLSERQQLITLIDQATDKGARLHIACSEVGISPHCQNSCHPHLNNPNGEKGDNHGTIQCRTQTSNIKQTAIA